MLIKKTEFSNVLIKDCFHYCGFYYGNSKVYNPYQNYMINFINDKDYVRKEFIDFLIQYRPESLNEAFSLNLSKKFPLWYFPWDVAQIYDNNHGLVDDPDDVPDLLTHFSRNGILNFRIEQEFYWLERAYFNIKNHGYNPKKFKYIDVFRFQYKQQKSYLVIDGNHRISALHSLGELNVLVKIIKTIDLNNYKKWPGVKSKLFSIPDAIKIFNFYMNRDPNKIKKTINKPCKILYNFEVI